MQNTRQQHPISTATRFITTILLSLLPALGLISKTSRAAQESESAIASTKLANISTRAFVGGGNNVMIGGFIVQGTQPKRIMARAIGPALSGFGVANALSDPSLTLYNSSGTAIAQNDNWQITQLGGVITTDQVSEIQSSYLAPSQSKEAAIIGVLAPGAYTAIVQSVDGSSGVGSVEVYDLSTTSDAGLVNLSTRCLVQTAEKAMIGGFIVEGNGPKRVLIKAVGPSLAQHGITNALSNPSLNLYNAAGTVIGTNDNWKTTQMGGVVTSDQVTDIQESQLAPLDPAESAIIATLDPGAYTAIVRGVNGATGVGLVELYDLTGSEGISPGQITTEGVSENAFNSTGSTLSFVITGETFSNDISDVQVYHNFDPIANSLVHLSPDKITVDAILNEGRNDIAFTAMDSHGQLVYEEYTFWAGDNILQGTILDENGQPANGVTVSLKLGDDQHVVATTTSASGSFKFTRLPGRTVFLDAVDSKNRRANASANGADGSVKLKLTSIGTPSSINNNDFSQGTAGWNIGTAPVKIIPHQEMAAIYSQEAASGDAGDLALYTQGEGPQSISRTFVIAKGTKNVTVRYRFITSEVPGGYFGTEYNDGFSVSLRSLIGGKSFAESQSMNGLGLAAFDANGATAWREASLPVDAEGDVVQVDLSVSNVGDGLYDSQLLVDLVDQKQIAITSLSLKDIDTTDLNYLSADGTNPYFGTKMRIFGTVTVQGPAEDGLHSLQLQIIQGGVVVATADLASTAQATLLTAFGSAGKVEMSSAQLLFELSATQAAHVAGKTNGTLSLRVRATSDKGQQATQDASPARLLVRYTNTNRFGGRDEQVGGDDWAQPSLRDLAAHYSGVSWNDFSNMNGGHFAPHKSHDKGLDVDGYFAGYEKRDATVAAQIIQHLNDSAFGSKVAMVGVTFQKTGTDTSFWDAIKNVTLKDGRKASGCIRNWPKHTDHFHWRIKGN